MELKVIGKGLISRKELLVAIPFMMKKMGAHQMLPYCHFEIEFTKSLAVKGSCVMLEKGEFDIKISNLTNLTYNDQISTLAHELVHVKQFYRGELKTDAGIWRYKKKEYYPTWNYLLMPWEIEAYGMEFGLASLYHQYALDEKSNVAKKSRR